MTINSSTKVLTSLLGVFAAAGFVKADNSQLLMLASQLDYMRAVVLRCEVLWPGYKAKFDENERLAKINFLDRVGINEKTFERAREIPELSIFQIVSKFDRSDEKIQIKYCRQNLSEIEKMAKFIIENEK